MIPVTQAILEFLRAQDISHVFGKVGEGIFPVLDRIRQEPLGFISTHRGEAAVLMADGYARVGGRPGVAFIPGGSSVLQTVSAMAQAFYDGSPVILIASELATTHLGKGASATHGINQQALFEKLTRFCGGATSPDRVIEGMEQAYRSAMSGKKGPVYWGIPSDFLFERTPESIRHHGQFMSSGLFPGDSELIRRACELLIQAHSPVILLGGGAVWSQASSEAMELAEMLFAPIVTSSSKSGVVPDDYPLSIGRLGSEANRAAHETVAEADLLISFGCAFNDRTTFGFSREVFSPSVKIIQVDIDPAQIGKNYPIELGIIGDAKMVLKAILFHLRQIRAEKWPSRGLHRIQRVWQRREAWSNQWKPLARSSRIPIGRLRLLQDLVDEIGQQGIIFGELKGKNCLKSCFFPLIEVDDFPVSGANLALAMGAKLALPDRQIVAVLSGGEFMPVLSDLATAVENRIPILAVITKDGDCDRTKVDQTQFYAQTHLGPEPPNFAELARSLGANAERVVNPADIRPTVRRALDSQLPTLIEVVVSGSPPPDRG